MMNCQLQSDFEITRSNWVVVGALLVLLSSTPSAFSQKVSVPRTPAQEQASLELNAAAASYREGNFLEAQRHSEKALEIDPENQSAPFFIARCIHAHYKPGDATPENQNKARDAIVAYQRILSKLPNDEESYKAIAYLYGALKEDQLLFDWVLKRAADTSVAADKRSEAYVVLASKHWDCSFKITELPLHKVTTIDEASNKAMVRYRKPKDEADFKQAQQCATQGLEFADQAIALEAENESAWSYKTNLLLELSKLAEMDGDRAGKVSFLAQYKFALTQTTKISESARKKPEPPEDRRLD